MRGMKRVHKLAAHVLTSFLTMGVAALAQAETLKVPPEIRIAVATAPKTLSPSIATDAAVARLMQLTHPALLTWNSVYQPTGLAAKSCIQNTPAQVTCTLAPGRKFTDGTPLTAGDVKKWFEMLQATPRSPFTGPLKGVTIAAPSEQTLIFNLSAPTLTFISTLTEIPLANPANPQSGLGPYTLGPLDASGNITLATSRTDIPRKLTFLTVPDGTTRMLKLKKGEADMVLNDLTPDLLQWAEKEGLPATTVSATSYSYLGLNFNNSTLAQPVVREALARAINRPALRKFLLAGMADPADSLLPPGHPAMFRAPEEPYSPQAAAEMLDENYNMPGPDGIRFPLTLLTSTDGFSQRVGQVIQNQLAVIGVDVTLRPTEWASFYDAVKKGQFDMVLLTWTGEQQPAFYHTVFNSRQTPPLGINRGHFSDSTVDALTEKILAAPTADEQNKLTIQVQKVLAEARPYIPLYRRHPAMVTRPGLTGCVLPFSGAYTGLIHCRLK